MSNKEWWQTEEGQKANAELETAAERAGGYVAHRLGEPLVMDYDYHAISTYCHTKGISRADLTEDELRQFAFDPPLVYPRKGPTFSRI